MFVIDDIDVMVFEVVVGQQQVVGYYEFVGFFGFFDEDVGYQVMSM